MECVAQQPVIYPVMQHVINSHSACSIWRRWLGNLWLFATNKETDYRTKCCWRRGMWFWGMANDVSAEQLFQLPLVGLLGSLCPRAPDPVQTCTLHCALCSVYIANDVNHVHIIVVLVYYSEATTLELCLVSKMNSFHLNWLWMSFTECSNFSSDLCHHSASCMACSRTCSLCHELFLRWPWRCKWWWAVEV